MASHLGNLTLITPAQSSGQAPHLQINDSSAMAVERVLHKLPLPPDVAEAMGFAVPTGLPSNVRVFAGELMQSSPLPDKKRPLNSWMAYRTYYAKIFIYFQQKVTSIYLTVLWRRDPFKSKWTIVAKAYSSIRDLVGKNNAPLDGFLDIVVPEIGLLEHDEYLETMGWNINYNSEGYPYLTQTDEPGLEDFDDEIAYTSMTERDVIVLCGDSGYINGLAVAKLIGGASNIATAQAPTQASQQGLLATAPAFPPPAAQNAKPADLFVHQLMTDPAAAASRVFGFDVNQMLGVTDGKAAKPYEWTGNMADLYTPGVGTIKPHEVSDDPDHGWHDTTEISDPASLDQALMSSRGAVVDGYLIPSAPEEY
ncbi:hypothetical protein PVAG01_08672 [Phlyctema vagabunda]|uniref:Alpha box domain-containing protein n=1 Tax=Phlyctema vagabunda TaxID=108571 RepID=A0ABR4PA56_9HELO